MKKILLIESKIFLTQYVSFIIEAYEKIKNSWIERLDKKIFERVSARDEFPVENPNFVLDKKVEIK